MEQVSRLHQILTNMNRVFSKPKHQTIILLVVAMLALLGVFKFQFVPKAQFVILNLLVVFYLGWAISYHHFDKSLKLEIIIEYVLIAALALAFFYGLLF